MPIAIDIEVTDNLTVKFGKRRENVIFPVDIVNAGTRNAKIKKISSSLEFVRVLDFNESNSVIKAGNQLSYLFEAVYGQQQHQQINADQNEGKIRFTFKDHTHITRSIKVVNETIEQKVMDKKLNESAAKTITPTPTRTPTNSEFTPGITNLKGFIKNDFENWCKKLDRSPANSIDINDNLLIEFDHFYSSKLCTIQIRNNTWKQLRLKSIEMDESKITMCEPIDRDKPMIIRPRSDLKLHFEAKFFQNKFSSKTQICFCFEKLSIRRTIKIHYIVRGPAIPKLSYDVPHELSDLITSRYRSRSQYMDALDNWVPTVQSEYATHFHHLLYLEECGLRQEIKRNYLQKEAFFGDQDYFKENGNTIRKKYAPGIYDLKINDLFEIRPSLQPGMQCKRF